MKQSFTNKTFPSKTWEREQKALAKYEAWEKLKGMSSEKATQDYVDLIERLKKRYSS